MQAFRYKEMKIHEQDAGHMTKMAATPLYGKNPSKIFFSGIGGPTSNKLGMKHMGLQPIIVCSNDDPGLTLTNFTARSNLVTLAFYRKKWKQWIFQKLLKPVTWKLVDADN